MKPAKTLVVILAIYTFALPLQATTINLTSDGLSLSKGNYGTSIVVDDFIQVSALTQITLVDSQTGIVYLDSKKGLGVQTSKAKGSKRISGGGKDDDEALVFDFLQSTIATSVTIGLYDYKSDKGDTLLTMTLDDGNKLSFTKKHQNWNSALTQVGKKLTSIDFGTLLGNTFGGGNVSSISVMERSGHIYVNSISATGSTAVASAAVPEPATMLLLCMGTLFLAKKPKSSTSAIVHR